MQAVSTKDIETRFANHRVEAFVTCPETCWCWDVEKLLFVIETSRVSARAIEAAVQDLLYVRRTYAASASAILCGFDFAIIAKKQYDRRTDAIEKLMSLLTEEEQKKIYRKFPKAMTTLTSVIEKE